MNPTARYGLAGKILVNPVSVFDTANHQMHMGLIQRLFLLIQGIQYDQVQQDMGDKSGA